MFVEHTVWMAVITNNTQIRENANLYIQPHRVTDTFVKLLTAIFHPVSPCCGSPPTQQIKQIKLQQNVHSYVDTVVHKYQSQAVCCLQSSKQTMVRSQVFPKKWDWMSFLHGWVLN